MTDDDTAAARIATAAGRELLALRARHAATIDAAALRDLGDQTSHDYIIAAIRAEFPADAVLSEEGKDDLARLDADRVWIVDPLDGTREFGELDRSDWAVHVALWANGELVAGAVALPALDITLSTANPPSIPAAGATLRLLVSRSRPPAETERIRSAVNGELVQMGSAGAKAMAVLRGEGDIYAHSGGQYEWDSAAPVAVALAAGLHATRLDGSRLQYNQPNTWLPDLLICRPEHAPTVINVAK